MKYPKQIYSLTEEETTHLFEELKKISGEINSLMCKNHRFYFKKEPNTGRDMIIPGYASKKPFQLNQRIYTAKNILDQILNEFNEE